MDMSPKCVKMKHNIFLCGLCNKRRKETLYKINTYGIYGSVESRYRFHTICLKKILADPVKYGNTITDKAIFISELLDQEAKSIADSTKERDIKLRRARKNLDISEILKQHFWKTVED